MSDFFVSLAFGETSGISRSNSTGEANTNEVTCRHNSAIRQSIFFKIKKNTLLAYVKKVEIFEILKLEKNLGEIRLKMSRTPNPENNRAKHI
ncbi:hypothetical protein BpHYR1_037001 [Brachionus plicatilis]|uniref:Uncharacterized protein n=1 Tax=Brachionus plicatilis TaxID=10195 RepID=A0A3M7SXW8_BRAPC|nr:hypothetical protein BpHYR1_037001 [Brachionus plicatilis]